MIAVFLSPYAFRGEPAPYLWVFYKFLASIEEPICFLLSADYLAAPGSPILDGRAELDPARVSALGYAKPSAEVLARHHFALMDSGLMHQLLPRYGGNPLAFFKAYLSEKIPELMQELRDRLATLPSDIEAIATWSNCPSLAAVAAERGIPVIYMEIGPLRSPQYRSTGYLDFSGVNGNTEAEARNAKANDFPEIAATIDDLRRGFALQQLERKPKGHMLGVVLQVEDDSNLLSFNNGYDNIGLITRALIEGSEDQLLIRAHPGSRFDLKPGKAARDLSPSVVAFLGECRKVLSINSSVGLEAILFDVPVDVFGEASYRYVAEESDPIQRLRKLSFYLFAYLVPFDLMFSSSYIRFRLDKPTESQIVARHLEGYGVSTVAELLSQGGSHASPTGILRAMSENIDGVAVEPVVDDLQAKQACLKLYYRDADDHYQEEFSRNGVAIRSDGFSQRIRFTLPAGLKPEFVRFDPGSDEGTYELAEVRWGWKQSADDAALFPLFDLSNRLVAFNGIRVDAGDKVKLLSANGHPFFELSVGDLWASDHVAGEGAGVVELCFTHHSSQFETLLEALRQGERLARVESHDTSERLREAMKLLDSVNKSSGMQLQLMERLLDAMASLSHKLGKEMN
ncbi:hypothetical protein ACCQ12_16880 [Xanthomonas sp. NCPPB 1068]|uniref:GT99 family glycosyltransferase N-terminal domain-containing protein n=1 Tax=Xanthomonas sp. NCPPB 1068 TaxID=487525 RepID=UPI0035586D5D